jgi:uncharacterized spore protein YtfJ
MATSESDESVGSTAEGLEALFGSLGDRLGRAARAAAVFGEPVERDGVTVIPVARARWGMGGGSGKRPKGVGGGGGAVVSPMGFIEIRAGAARFKPIVSLKVVFSFLVAVVALVLGAWKLRRE